MADGSEQDSVHARFDFKVRGSKEGAPMSRNKERVPFLKKRHAIGLSIRLVRRLPMPSESKMNS